MSEILRLISASPGNLGAVLQSVAEQAAHICQAQYVDIFIVENDDLRNLAWFGEIKRTLTFPLDRSSVSGRSVCDMRPVSVDDMQNAGDEFARGREVARKDGHRSIVAVPLTREGRALGTIVVSRTEVRPFERKHIDLLTSFAAQAIIAIENARLLNELRQRTDDLTESLQQQTATSEILDVISNSPTDSQPAFDAIVRSGLKLFPDAAIMIALPDGDIVRSAAVADANPIGAEALRARTPLPLSREFITSTAILDRREVDLPDARDAPPELAAGARNFLASGYRAMTVIPMMRGESAIGALDLMRRRPGPLSDKQRELLRTFARQAVIAIENTRLFNELHQRTADLSESLEQQTATSEVLKVISSSPGDLQPVFSAMLESAGRLCDASFGNIFRWDDDDALRLVATYNTPAAFADARSQLPLRRDQNNPIAEMLAAKTVLHVDDLAADERYIKRRDPNIITAVELGGVRTFLAVPMLKDNELIGALILYRQEVQPFTEKQIGLLQNFAAQAVIAIENARLLNELRERTQEVVKLNQQLEQRVADQVGEIERMSRLRRFLPPQVADLIVASGTEKQLESHRRGITALFCDLRGFTGFSESSDPEDVMALLSEYHAASGEIIIKYSGTLERYAGDGVMVIFNDPVPVENPALHVLMALDMRAALGGLIEKWRDLGHDLGFGIGIAHGFATLGTIGFEGRRDYAAIGTVSNVASRLCDEAKPGQILISPRVRQAVEKAVRSSLSTSLH
jgi:GAF domain-containing protein